MLSLLTRKQHRVIDDPPFVYRLFNDARFAVFWLVVRVWLGWQWIDAASHKIGNPAWTETGEALLGYWQRAVAIPEQGRPLITFDWYRDFLQSLIDANAHTWFAQVVSYGELLIGIALIIGAFVGIAAFFGAFMNMNFMLAGSASTNPVLFLAALGLMFAWKIGGFIGLDYFLLNLIGTPWNRKVVQAEPELKARPAPAAAGD